MLINCRNCKHLDPSVDTYEYGHETYVRCCDKSDRGLFLDEEHQCKNFERYISPHEEITVEEKKEIEVEIDKEKIQPEHIVDCLLKLMYTQSLKYDYTTKMYSIRNYYVDFILDYHALGKRHIEIPIYKDNPQNQIANISFNEEENNGEYKDIVDKIKSFLEYRKEIESERIDRDLFNFSCMLERLVELNKGVV